MERYVTNYDILPDIIAMSETKLKLSKTGPQRENFPGGSKVDTGPPNLIGPPKAYRGPCC